MASNPTSPTGKKKSSPTKHLNTGSEVGEVKITCEFKTEGVDENEVPMVDIGSNNDVIATAPKLELDQNIEVMQSVTKLHKNPKVVAKESLMWKTSETKVSTSSSKADLIKAKKIKRSRQPQQQQLQPHEQIKKKWQQRISAASTRMTRSATAAASTEQHKQQ